MKAIQIKKFSSDSSNLTMVECEIPTRKSGEVLIKVEAFGLNFADIMARKGKYRDAPSLPFIPGYDVVGTIFECDAQSGFKIGQRVCALTRFGGYAEFAVAQEMACSPIDNNMSVTTALSLATQGATAWYCAEEVVQLRKKQRVLITAAAGGVGSILVQLCALKECQIYGIVGSKSKEKIVRDLGAHEVLFRNESDVFEQYKQKSGHQKIDIFFDSAGGTYTKNGIKMLSPGGAYVGYGASQNTQIKTMFGFLKFALSFGFYHPASFLTESKALIGVNMLRLADHKPELLKKSMESIIELHAQHKIIPLEGASFSVEDIHLAHSKMEHGEIPGKIAIHF